MSKTLVRREPVVAWFWLLSWVGDPGIAPHSGSTARSIQLYRQSMRSTRTPIRTSPGLSAADRRPPPWDLLLIITGALLLVALARLHVFIPGAEAARPGLLLLVAGTAVWFLQGDSIKRLGRPIPLGSRLAVFLLIWAMIGVPFALWPGQAFSSLISPLGTTILLFLMVAASIRHVVDVRRLLAVMAVGGGLFAVLAPIQGRRASRGFAGGGYDPNDAAMFLVSMVPVLVFFAVKGKRLVWRVLSGLAAVAALVAIVDTQSRGGFLGIAAVLLFMLLFYRGIGTLSKGAVVAAVCLGLVATADGEYWERMESITVMEDGYGTEESAVGGRLQIWERGIGYMTANPITGVGLENFSVAEGQSPVIAERIRRGLGTKFSVAHSMWIQVGAELGIPGILAFLLLFGHVSRRMWLISRRKAHWRSDPETAFMASSILAMLVGLAVSGSFLSNAYWSMVWAPLALGMMLSVRVAAEGPRNGGTGPKTAMTPSAHPTRDFWEHHRSQPQHTPHGGSALFRPPPR